MLTEATALARMTVVQTPCANMPGGPWELCACLFVGCNHQLGVGSPGPALGDGKRTVGCVPPLIYPLITYPNILCLAAGPGPSRHCNSDGQRTPFTPEPAPGPAAPEAQARGCSSAILSSFALHVLYCLTQKPPSLGIKHTCYPGKRFREQGSKVS